MRVKLKYRAWAKGVLYPPKVPVDWPENIKLPEGAVSVKEPEMDLLDLLAEEAKEEEEPNKEPQTLSELAKKEPAGPIEIAKKAEEAQKEEKKK